MSTRTTLMATAAPIDLPNAWPAPGLVIPEKQAAPMVDLSVRHLQRLRVEGGGPPFIQLGARRIGYRVKDLEAWIASRRVVSTSAAAVGRRT